MRHNLPRWNTEPFVCAIVVAIERPINSFRYTLIIRLNVGFSCPPLDRCEQGGVVFLGLISVTFRPLRESFIERIGFSAVALRSRARVTRSRVGSRENCTASPGVKVE